VPTATPNTPVAPADDGFATILEAARFLRLGRSSVYRLMDEGKLGYAKFGKSRRIPWRVLRAYAEGCLVEPRSDE
jgi:excisionase family DNA binding protein